MSAANVLLVTLMRPNGGSGVQTHVRTFRDYLRGIGRPNQAVTPFRRTSVVRLAVFGLRLAIRRLSPTAGVWWYRYWHGHFLERELRVQLTTAAGNVVICAQCPVSAGIALQARSLEPVVMVAHFNISQADEWADKGEIQRDGRYFKAIRRFEEETLARLDGIVYVSEFSRSELEQRIPEVAQLPSVVVPNCVPLSSEPPAAPTGDVVIVGSLEPRKNQSYLLEVIAAASRQGRHYEVSIVGDGPDRRRLSAEVTRLGLERQVTFLGHCDDPRAVVRRHRVYCHTATIESFGIVLIEAMAEGVPVVAGRVGGIPEVVRPGVDGAFWPLDDPQAASRVLIDLLDDDDRRRRMGAAARQRVREMFTPEQTGAQLVDFLDRVASVEHSGRRP